MFADSVRDKSCEPASEVRACSVPITLIFLRSGKIVMGGLWSSAARPEGWDIDGKRLPRLPTMFSWCFGDGVAPGGPLL